MQIAASSRDIRLRAPLRLGATYTAAIPGLEDQSQPHPAPGDLAAGRPATGSSVEKAGLEAANATDGDNSTRWSSQFSDPQWLAVDLGKPVTIDHARLTWDPAYASAYTIQVSADSRTWANVYSTQHGFGGLEQVKFAPVAARWVRVLGTQRATQFGYSMLSFEVFAPAQ